MLVTIAMQNVLIYAVNLADNVMLGKYSELAMSGTALVNQIQFLLQMLIQGTGEGIIVIAARHWGEEDVPSIKRVTSVGMRWALVFSFVMFAGAFFFPDQVLGILTNKEPLIKEAAKYLRIIAFTYPVFAVTNVLLASLRSVETTRIGFWVSLTALFTNISLNYVFIFGKLGIPEMGIRGAAIATLISRVIELVIVVVYTFFADKKIKLKVSDFLKKTGDMPKRFIKTSLPVILSSGSWGIAMGLQTAILGRMEDSVVPANSIAATVFSIVTVFIYGSATAASVALGKMIGRDKKDISEGLTTHEQSLANVKSKAKALQLIFLGLGLVSSLALFLMKGPIIGFYDIADETKVMADSFMTVLCVTMIGTAYQMPSLSGIIRAGGDTSFVFYNDLIFMWGIVLPASFLSAFVFKLAPVIVFICLKSDQVLKCFVALFKVNRFRWIKDI
ncbi:MAG: MATE family efflux transporter [Clostridia bacterium]|nr:MATE family efflux transporter [Clostridia bacterium]